MYPTKTTTPVPKIERISPSQALPSPVWINVNIWDSFFWEIFRIISFMEFLIVWFKHQARSLDTWIKQWVEKTMKLFEKNNIECLDLDNAVDKILVCKWSQITDRTMSSLSIIKTENIIKNVKFCCFEIGINLLLIDSLLFQTCMERFYPCIVIRTTFTRKRMLN